MPKISPQEPASVTTREVAAYDSARRELVQRIVLRDQALIAFIVATSAFFGFALQSENPSPVTETVVSLALPLISLCFTLVVLQHELVIGLISAFLQTNLMNATLHWDNSPQYASSKMVTVYRTVAQMLALCSPSMWDVSNAVANIYEAGSAPVVIWNYGIAAYSALVALAVVVLHIQVYRMREKVTTQAGAAAVVAPPARRLPASAIQPSSGRRSRSRPGPRQG